MIHKNTDGFAERNFRPHGRIEMWTEGAVVHLISEGPFNREVVIALGKLANEIYASIAPGTRFVNINQIRTSLMGTPEALEMLENHLKSLSAAPVHPLLHVWVVGAEVEGHHLMLPVIQAVFARANRPMMVFDNLQAAESAAREALDRD